VVFAALGMFVANPWYWRFFVLLVPGAGIICRLELIDKIHKAYQEIA